ncbi:MAG: hypothetical protein AAGG44_18710, partial [Planctomycetota bacterium]
INLNLCESAETGATGRPTPVSVTGLLAGIIGFIDQLQGNCRLDSFQPANLTRSPGPDEGEVSKSLA